jgi:multidrug efflux pump subunit AcrB
MKLSERSLQNPAAVAAAAAIVILFGVLAMLRLPIQLLPDTRQPQLIVNAEWREAAPAELEEALVEPIEEAMRGLPGLVEMNSESNRGRGGVQLTFEVGTDMTRVMLDVVSRLNTLPPLPPDAEESQVFGGDNFQTQNAASLLIRPLAGHTVPDIAVQYQQLMEEIVEPRLARVPGVSRVNLEGGRPREVRVTFDPHRLAALGLSPQRLAQTVIAARDVSAAFANVGRRQFTVRVTGREPVTDLGDLVVGWSDDRPLYLRDVADIRTEHVEAFWFSYRSGVPAYYITLQRTSDSNTVEVVDGIKQAIAELNAGPLAKEELYADLSWDASVYVRRAIGFVEESLGVGILLAVGGLWYFLRGPRALLVIGASIPISLFFAIITMHVLGRTLNVVSLAGLAFLTGIVVDAALIVQGNVLRFMQEGKDAWHATVEGAGEVLPALLASMLTSVAIFLPILFMEGLEGQLFKDLAITMSVSHAASLLVAITVIPAANRWALARGIPSDQHARWWRAMSSFAMRLTNRPAARLDRRHHGRQPARHLAAGAESRLPAGRADRHDLEQHAAAARRQHRDRARRARTPRDRAVAALPRGHEAAESEVLQLLGIRRLRRHGRGLPRRSPRHPRDGAAAARGGHGRHSRHAGVHAARLAAERRRRQRARDSRRLPGRRPRRADARGEPGRR